MSIFAHDRLRRAHARMKQSHNSNKHLRVVVQQHLEPGSQLYITARGAQRSATGENPSELESASTQTGAIELGPQNPTE